MHKYQHIYLYTIYINTYTDCIDITDSNILILTNYCDFSTLKHFVNILSDFVKDMSDFTALKC